MPAETLILGLDGATWDVIEPLQQRLPNLWRLRQEGVWGHLASTTPPMTLPAWTSILTGVNPGAHGILDFTRRPEGRYAVEFLNATHRAAPSLHRVLSDQGARVASIAVPGTWPPEPLNGVMIAGFDSPVATRAEALHCQPPALFAELEQRFGALRFADFQEGDITPGWHAHALAALQREIARKEAICQYLLEREDWALFMVVFGESDTASHHFWMLHDPNSPRHGIAHRWPAQVREGLARVYERLDAAVGALMRWGRRVCLVSDHGFGGAGTQALYLNRYLEQTGWLRFHPPQASRLARLGGALRQRALASSLPVERLIRRVPRGWLGAVESRARYGDIDFAHTRAWSDELNYAATIHLNLRGRDPLGTLPDRRAAIAALTEVLLAWREGGERVVERVIPREAALSGVALSSAPDLYLELTLSRSVTPAGEGGYSRTLLPSSRVPAGTTARTLTEDEWPGGKGLGMNGSHRPNGVFALWGEGVAGGGRRVDAHTWDIAPTLLHAAQRPIPAHMEGVVLDALTSTAPPRRSAAAAPAAPSSSAYTPQQAAALERRLQALGYL